MKVTDEQLMAYVDGELDPAQRAEVEAQIARDSGLAAALERQRRLRDRLHAGMDEVLDEPVPDRLLAVLRAPQQSGHSAGTAGAASNVIALPVRPAAAAPRFRYRTWGAMAASLLLGVALGIAGGAFRSGGDIAAGSNGMLARGQLAAALTTQLAGRQSDAAPVRIGLSFKARGGEYCRTFTLRQEQALNGLACRRGGAWRIQLLTESGAGSAAAPEYRQAGSGTPAAILQWVNREMVGEPLDADAEAAASRAGWRSDSGAK